MVHGTSISGEVYGSIRDGFRNFHGASWIRNNIHERVHQDGQRLARIITAAERHVTVAVATNKLHHIADQLSAGAAIGYGAKVTLIGEIDMIVSIIAGILVAFSAGLSIYLNIKQHNRRQKEEEKTRSDK